MVTKKPEWEKMADDLKQLIKSQTSDKQLGNIKSNKIST